MGVERGFLDRHPEELLGPSLSVRRIGRVLLFASELCIDHPCNTPVGTLRIVTLRVTDGYDLYQACSVTGRYRSPIKGDRNVTVTASVTEHSIHGCLRRLGPCVTAWFGSRSGPVCV